MHRILAERIRFFLDPLGYEAENLAVPASRSAILAEVFRTLGQQEVNTVDVRSDKFDLETSPGVRLSTLHSAEGLEFSEVFLVLSRLRIKRNMDHAEALALQYLVRAFEQISVP